MRGDIGKGKFKPQSDYYYVSIRMAKMKKKISDNAGNAKYNSATSLKNILAVSYKTKHSAIICPSHHIPWHLSQKNKVLFSNKKL